MIRITRREELVQLARDLGTRPDWHEPDEQEVDAVVRGNDFDNAGFWPEALVRPAFSGKDTDGTPYSYPEFRLTEKHVVIKHHGEAVAAVNLATLLAWASEA